MSARAAILAAVGGTAPVPGGAAALVRAPERPVVSPDGVMPAFLDRLAQPSVAATVERIAAVADLPAAVARYLSEAGLAPRLYLPPDPRVDALDWAGITRDPAAATDQPAALAWARAGIAETGSLVLGTSGSEPMLPNFLTLHHIVVVEAATVVAQLEDVPRVTPAGRAEYWITGVSGTTDIEGQYVRGAHGPRFLHVVIVG